MPKTGGDSPGKIKGRPTIRKGISTSPVDNQRGSSAKRGRNSSDISGDEFSEDDLTSSFGSIHTIIPERANYEYSKSYMEISARSESSLNRSTQSKHEISSTLGRTSQSNTACYTFAVIVASIIIGFFVYTDGTLIIASPKTDIKCPQFKELTKEFPHQDKLLWRSLQKGIENVLNRNPSQPSVFLIAYNDMATSKNVMDKILNATVSCMKSQEPIKIDGGSFATEEMVKDYGVIIGNYRERLQKEGIMFVEDVNRTPARAAQAFHAICDTETPLVERAVIFFTVRLDEYDANMEPNRVHSLIENKLERNWGKDTAINEDILKALIVRMTDQMFLLHSENV